MHMNPKACTNIHTNIPIHEQVCINRVCTTMYTYEHVCTMDTQTLNVLMNMHMYVRIHMDMHRHMNTQALRTLSLVQQSRSEHRCVYTLDIKTPAI